MLTRIENWMPMLPESLATSLAILEAVLFNKGKPKLQKQGVISRLKPITIPAITNKLLGDAFFIVKLHPNFEIWDKGLK